MTQSLTEVVGMKGAKGKAKRGKVIITHIVGHTSVKTKVRTILNEPKQSPRKFMLQNFKF